MIYKCLCNVNYQIMVNREFHTSFLDIVIRIPQNNTNITKMEKFFAFIILLKFNPENAVFFLPTRMRNIMYFRSCPNLLKFLLHLMVKLYLEMLMVKWKIEDDLQNTRMRYLWKYLTVSLNGKCDIRTLGSVIMRKINFCTGVIYIYGLCISFGLHLSLCRKKDNDRNKIE